MLNLVANKVQLLLLPGPQVLYSIHKFVTIILQHLRLERLIKCHVLHFPSDKMPQGGPRSHLSVTGGVLYFIKGKLIRGTLSNLLPGFYNL